ncbi:MAG TPA: 2-oxo acid dehydrogenase subunit E2 [Streptosporangiaceae bacterium]|nr:2-oxo acid dehydrogenase subunit E2 [Streptosporangiaceae bacterium]
MRGITVPRLNANDDACTLVDWMCQDGADVDGGTAVAVVETAKAAADVCAESAGVIHQTVGTGAECRVGDVIGYVFADEAARQAYLLSRADGTPDAGSPDGPIASPSGHLGTGVPGLVLTEAASRLAGGAGVSSEQLRSLGKRIVRAADVEALLEKGGQTQPSILSPRQEAIARVVARSHASIPDAFAAVAVYCDEVLARLQELNTADGPQIGLPEVAVATLGRLRPHFPVFFASFGDTGQLVVPEGDTHIGVTIDVGTGLFVPVIRNAGGRSAADVADDLMDFRVKAMRTAFRTEDLRDGQLTLSLHMEPDVLVAVPLVLPPQVCIVSLGSVRTEVVLDEAGLPRQRSYLTVGLTYDHRVINGRDAMRFLAAFKSAVEQVQEVGL